MRIHVEMSINGTFCICWWKYLHGEILRWIFCRVRVCGTLSGMPSWAGLSGSTMHKLPLYLLTQWTSRLSPSSFHNSLFIHVPYVWKMHLSLLPSFLYPSLPLIVFSARSFVISAPFSWFCRPMILSTVSLVTRCPHPIEGLLLTFSLFLTFLVGLVWVVSEIAVESRCALAYGADGFAAGYFAVKRFRNHSMALHRCLNCSWQMPNHVVECRWVQFP